MKKTMCKKIIFFIFIAILILSISTISFASLVDIKGDANAPGADKIKKISQTILGIIQVVAVAVAVIMLVILAIKYMTAAPGEKADVKMSLLIYVIGALVLFAGASILKWVQNLANDINSKVAIYSETVSIDLEQQTIKNTKLVSEMLIDIEKKG